MEGRTSESGGRLPSEGDLDAVLPPLAGGRELRVGAFMLLGVGAFMAVLFLLTDPATFRGRYMIQTVVEEAGGIRRGDPVQMRGVNIGRVHRFDMAPQGVTITLELDGRWTIPEDSRTRLAGADLLGGRTVEVLPGVSERMLPAGGTIPGASATGVMELADVIAEEALGTMERIRSLMDEGAISALHSSAREMEALLRVISEVVDEQRGSLESLTGSLNRAATGAEELLAGEALGRSVARADSAMAVLQETGESLGRASESLEVVLERIRAGEGTLGRLSSDDQLYTEMRETMEEFRALARDIRENPSRYVRLRLF